MPGHVGHSGELAAAAQQGFHDAGGQADTCCAGRLENAAAATCSEVAAFGAAGDDKVVIGLADGLAKSVAPFNVAKIQASFIAFTPLSYYARSARILR